jgi:hypothetical protein
MDHPQKRNLWISEATVILALETWRRPSTVEGEAGNGREHFIRYGPDIGARNGWEKTSLKTTASLLLPVFGAAVVYACQMAYAEPPYTRLVGAFWWMTTADMQRSSDAWREDLDRLQALGMDLLVVSGSFVNEVSSTTPDNQGAEPLKGFFDEADRRGLRIFINTLSMPNWWMQPDAGPETLRAGECIRNIARCCGTRQSFFGWYVPYELYMFWDKQADLIRTLYREVSLLCKTALNKPVMISPFFILDQAHNLGDFRWATSEEYQAFWTDVLKQASIDIVALQDSGEHLSYYTMEDRRPFFAAMKSACDAAGKAFWANIETAELDVKSPEEYVARFGRKTHVNDPKLAAYWRGVPAAKLEEKLRFVGAFTSTAITWGYQEYVQPSSRPDAKALYESYLALGLASRRP